MINLHTDELLLEKLREEEEDERGPRRDPVMSEVARYLAERLRERGPIELPKRQLSELEKRYP